MRNFKLCEKHFPAGSSKLIQIKNNIVVNSNLSHIKEGDVILSCVEYDDVCIIKKREETMWLRMFKQRRIHSIFSFFTYMFYT